VHVLNNFQIMIANGGMMKYDGKCENVIYKGDLASMGGHNESF
jgi:hypothetical protein